MERPVKKIHDDGSSSFEGDGFKGYYEHELDHKKGRGDTPEHKGQWNHSDMHKKPRNK